jgi:hypothetical protein
MPRARRAAIPIHAEPCCCAYCGSGLRHELFRFTLTSPDGSWPVCPRCIEGLVDRMERAHAEAGELLESWWEASAEP